MISPTRMPSCLRLFAGEWRGSGKHRQGPRSRPWPCSGRQRKRGVATFSPQGKPSVEPGLGKERAMTLIAHPRNLDQVERGIEDALRSFAGREANGVELPEITAAQRIDKIGNMSALAIIEASETTARDIEAAAQAAVDIAADIMKEAQQLASELRASGNKIGERLREFATLAKKVSTAMRDTRAKVLSPPEEKTPLAT